MRCLVALILTLGLLVSAALQAADLHFVIPAGPGGGLDGTARTVGGDLQRLGLIDAASYENVTGGGGDRAMNQFVTMGAHRTDALLVNSTPLVIRGLQGLFPHRTATLRQSQHSSRTMARWSCAQIVQSTHSTLFANRRVTT